MENCMKNLSQLFLINSPQLDKTALHLYAKAVKKIKFRLKAKNKTAIIGADEVSAELETMLRRDFYRQDLLNPQLFLILKEAVYNWQPKIMDDPKSMQKFGLIQNLLLAILPIFRKKQLLDKVCNNYKRHLASAITKSEFFNEKIDSKSIQASSVINLKMVDIFVKRQVKQKIADENLQLSIEKYKAVDKIQKTLHSKCDATQQLHCFRHEFINQRAIIEKKRDKKTMIFVKTVITVFSIGLAAVFGIWNIKGRQTTNKINSILAA